jgi:integrase
MAYIQKRINGDGTTAYRVLIRLKGYPSESATFGRLTDARDWAKKTESDMKAGRHFGEGKRHTLSELIRDYSAWKANRIRHFDERKTILARWEVLLGDCALDAVTPSKIASARDDLLKEPVQRGGPKGKAKSGATVNRAMAYLSDALAYAVKEKQWLERNPCERVSKFKESPGVVRYLSDAERDALLKACQASTNADIYTAVVLSLTTGGRQSEVLGLTWGQVDFKRRLITLRDGETKNGEGRVLPLVGKAFDMLQARHQARQAEAEKDKVRPLRPKPEAEAKRRRLAEMVFPPSDASKSGKPIQLHAAWNRAREAAGLGHWEGEGEARKFRPDFRWHDLRHTSASYLAMQGTSPLEISKILGHKTMAMVSRYSHLAPSHINELGDKLAARMGLQ